MTAPDTSPAAMPRPTHLIYIDRARVFDAGVTWTTVAGLYPHAYAPVEAFDALSAERDRLAAQVVQLQRDLDAAKVRAERAEAALCTWPSCKHTAKGQCRNRTGETP